MEKLQGFPELQPIRFLLRAGQTAKCCAIVKRTSVFSIQGGDLFLIRRLSELCSRISSDNDIHGALNGAWMAGWKCLAWGLTRL